LIQKELRARPSPCTSRVPCDGLAVGSDFALLRGSCSHARVKSTRASGDFPMFILATQFPRTARHLQKCVIPRRDNLLRG